MKIAVSSTGKTFESILEQRFGRTPYFIIVDTDTLNIEAINNVSSASTGGAGISSAQIIVDKGVEVVITGNVGPNAMNVLRAADIDIYMGYPVTVEENVAKFKNGQLDKISAAVSQHSGMGMK